LEDADPGNARDIFTSSILVATALNVTPFAAGALLALAAFTITAMAMAYRIG
jgi:hypothetical protein